MELEAAIPADPQLLARPGTEDDKRRIVPVDLR